jgi:hypothetical protein
MPLVGTFEQVCVTRRKVRELAEHNLVARLKGVGGEACDYCKKTLIELGMERLECCSQCKFMYYCNKDSQKVAWRAGHKQSCRKPDRIEAGDYMKLANLSRNEFSGHLVKVVDEDKLKTRTSIF